MEYRNIFLANPARLSVQREQLVIEQAEKITVPLEDISSVLIESQQVTLSVHAAAAMADHGITVFLRREAFAKLPAAPDQPVLPSAKAAAIAVRDGQAAAKAALAADRRPENTKSGAVPASDGEGRMAGASANGRKSPFQ